MKAIWKDEVIAESNETIVVENNHYFPRESVKDIFLATSDTHTVCPWKGEAHYYDVVVHGEINADAAWYYPMPSEKAIQIKDHIAFWKGVVIQA
ncbi:nucleotidyltransferase-like protein [Dyadobacter jejuensis]|uniref:Nucleotidyltransferase-like protein n=1 Tax=Dyadobacter jejuensis TaxID=1082580 RepID=A0A316AMN9_9BACT|nr:DUF427 domain-containing protein [Dyadobacter jejuensis]PWJ58802.1 nucleotidyltransferase-like protein [Dyadobacter jejuensis]